MTLETALVLIERYYDRLVNSNCTSTKRDNGQKIIEILSTYPEAKKYWIYDESQMYWKDRFQQIASLTPPTDIIVKSNILVDRKFIATKNSLLNEGGIYLITTTSVDIATNTIYYWVKIGCSPTDLKKRLNQYSTYNPMYNIVDYEYCANPREIESRYKHTLMTCGAVAHHSSSEWKNVSKEFYEMLLSKKLSFFNNWFDYYLNLKVENSKPIEIEKNVVDDAEITTIKDKRHISIIEKIFKKFCKNP